MEAYYNKWLIKMRMILIIKQDGSAILFRRKTFTVFVPLKQDTDTWTQMAYCLTCHKRQRVVASVLNIELKGLSGCRW